MTARHSSHVGSRRHPLGWVGVGLGTLQIAAPRAVLGMSGRIQRGELDPTRIITHVLPLEEAPRGYDLFKNKKDNCEKVVLKP
jgi:threonine dehydrogenase-like Zn-dependent dehydrogenase